MKLLILLVHFDGFGRTRVRGQKPRRQEKEVQELKIRIRRWMGARNEIGR
jgi:hypothetical protein